MLIITNSINFIINYNVQMKSKKLQEAKAKKIEVAVRMRPLLHNFQDESIWYADTKNRTVSSMPRNSNIKNNSNSNSVELTHLKRKSTDSFNNYNYNFDYVFNHQTTNQEIFQTSCSKIIDGFLEGFNSTIFMYGQTTSGKTYTMLGDNQNQGIITYSLLDIFNKYTQINLKHKKFELWICYLEIYNQQINDLLNPGSMNLKIIEDSINGVCVQGLKQSKVQTIEDAQQLLIKGQQQRSYKEKNIHDHSSRSHTIFQIKINEIGKKETRCCLNLVDLAGSQRLQDEDKANEISQQTGYINKSLFVLSNVINKLASGKKNTHIPFRDSKLTRLLSNALVGNSLTMIICTLSPAAMNFYQTLSTLRFATNAKKIETKPIQIQNDDSFDKQNIKQYINRKNRQNQELKIENANLKKQLNESLKNQKILKQRLKEVQYEQSISKQASTASSERYQQQQFLIRLKTKIEQQLLISNNHHKINAWQTKSYNLCEQYSKNIQILHQKYKLALFNIAQNEFPQHRKQLYVLMKEPSTASIYQKITKKQIFNNITVSIILNSEYSQAIQVEQLNVAYNEARKSLLERYIELKKYLLKKNQGLLLSTLEKLFSQKMNVIQKAYKQVFTLRQF